MGMTNMPYIKKEDRKRLAYTDNKHPQTAGELNYLITILVQRYIKEKGICYQSFNDVVGALEGCKLELTRRFTNSYEDEKILQNGDVNIIGGNF